MKKLYCQTDAEYLSCQTPSQQNGLCKPPKNCPIVLKIMQERPTSPENRDFLGMLRLLCCPNEEVQTISVTAPSARTTETSSLPVVSKPASTDKFISQIGRNFNFTIKTFET